MIRLFISLWLIINLVFIIPIRMSSLVNNNNYTNHNKGNRSDSWIYYSVQVFNDENNQNGSDNGKRQPSTESYNIHYHGYLPPVDHIEDPPLSSSSSSSGRTSTEIPKSIQDLLEPAEATNHSDPETQALMVAEPEGEYDDRNDAYGEDDVHPPDDDEFFGPDPDREPQQLPLQNAPSESDNDYDYDQPESGSSDEDEDDEPSENEIQQQQPRQPESADNDNDDDRDDDRDDQDDLDNEDFSDGGETQRIDREIVIPKIMLAFDDQLHSPADDSDFDFDEKKFDQEYSAESINSIMMNQNETQPENLTTFNDQIIIISNDTKSKLVENKKI